MTKKYKVLAAKNYNTVEEELNQLAAAGWEIVSVNTLTHTDSNNGISSRLVYTLQINLKGSIIHE